MGNLEEEEVAIIEEIAEVLARIQKGKLPALRDIPRKNLLEETSKVDKVSCKFKAHSIANTNEICYAIVVVTNTLRVKINKAAEREDPMCRKRVQNKIKELRKD